MKRVAYITLIIPALILVCYFNGLRSPFIFDDLEIIQELQETGPMYMRLPIRYRHLFYLSYAGTEALAGWRYIFFHLENILIHIGVSFFVFMVAAHAKKTMGLQGRAFPLIVALLFAVHPLQTEAVTYISGRASSLSALFCFASLLFYIRGSGSNGWWHIASLLFFGMALMVKETAIVLPILTLLYDRCFIGGNILQSNRKWFFIPAIVPPVYILFTGEVWQWLDKIDLSFAMMQVNVLAHVLKLSLLPVNQVFDYDFSQAFLRGMSWLIFPAIAALYWVNKTARPFLIFGLAWFLIAISPTNSILPRYDLLSERNLYLPVFGLMFATVCPILKGFERRGTPLLIGLILILSALTIERNAVYVTGLSLWSDTAAKSPHKFRAIENRKFYEKFHVKQ